MDIWQKIFQGTICSKEHFAQRNNLPKGIICPRDNLPKRQFTQGVIFKGTICPRDNLPKGQFAQGTICPQYNMHKGQFLKTRTEQNRMTL